MDLVHGVPNNLKLNTVGTFSFFLSLGPTLTICSGWFIEWFGAVGTTVGFCCGMAVLWIPFVALLLVPAIIAKAETTRAQRM
jgi:hypothetical protein